MSKKALKGLEGWIPMFATGKHPGKGEGASHTFTTDDLSEVIANLSADNPVPHVITHEKMYSPFAFAHGVEAKQEDGTLFVRSEKINEDFEALVKSGALYERSVGLIKSAKGWALDHIAWLGAEPPAVQGLAPVQFGKKEDVVLFSFVDTSTPHSLKSLARSIRDYFLAEKGQEVADSVVPEYMIESIEWGEQRARTEQDKQWEKNNSTFTKAKGAETVEKFTQEQLDQAKKDAAAEATTTAEANFKKEKDEQAATFERTKRKTDWDTIVSDAIDDGRMTPAMAEGLAEFAANLPTGDDAVITFSRKAADGKTDEEVKKPAIDFLAEFVKAMPTKVAMAKFAKNNIDDEGQEIDTTDVASIQQKAAAYQKSQADAGITVSVGQAVTHVTQSAAD